VNVCDICRCVSTDAYPVDGHFVCDRCLTQGRLSEMPDYASIELHELDPAVAGVTISSWWNRDIPVHIAR
jgi:hypothetical protein